MRQGPSIMGKIYDTISDEIAVWLRQQHVFFVATSPLDSNGHINCSPKGGDSFRIINSKTVAYQDLTGSGIETVAHVRENSRIVIMFCAFEGPPKIIRLYGKGEVIDENSGEYRSMVNNFSANVGARAIIRIKLTRVSDSCGYAVPLFNYAGDRDVLDKFAIAKGEAELRNYRKKKNVKSIDGLPGLDGI
jgi:hypothetical protein